METFYHHPKRTERLALPGKYLSPTSFGLDDLGSSSDSLECRSISPLSYCSGVSDYCSSNCSYLDSGLDLTTSSLYTSSLVHEPRSLPVAEVIPSKSQHSPPRRTNRTPPSTLDIKQTYHPVDSTRSFPSSHSLRDIPPSLDNFVALDATLNQTILTEEATRSKWSASQPKDNIDDAMMHTALNTGPTSSYGLGLAHSRSPVKSDIHGYSSYTPTTDIHAGLGVHGKTPTDYDDGSGFGSTYGSCLKAHDLTQWQQQLQHQQHQQQLQRQQQLQQQLERLQLSQTGVGYPYSGSMPGSHLGQDHGKLEGVIRAKDSILEEKNLIIERQKLELAHTQEQLRQKQAQERHLMYTRTQEDKGDFLLMKVQEYQYENATLKAQLAEHVSSKAAELEQFSKKLGGAEYEIEQLKKTLKEASMSKVKELKDLEKKICQKDESGEEIKGKYNRIKGKYETLKERVVSLERYMGDLPTAEQHLKNTEVIKNLCEKERVLKERISHLENSLAESRSALRDRDVVVNNLEGRESDQRIEMENLRSEASRLQSALGAPRNTDPNSLKLFSSTAMDKLVQERDEAVAEVNKLKQLVESKHRQLRAQQSHHVRTISELEERLQQEESTSMALTESARSKEDNIKKMKDSMTALAKQSQELYEHNLDVQERNQTLEKIASADVIQCSHRLIHELGECVAELHALVQVCTQTADGQEPNVSVLLRFRTPSVASESEGASADGGFLNTETLRSRLKQVKDLRAEIDRLRGVVSNKYAEDMGNECITQ